MLCSNVQKSLLIMFFITVEPVFNISIEPSEQPKNQETLVIISPPVNSDLEIASRVLNLLTNKAIFPNNKLVQLQRRMKRKNILRRLAKRQVQHDNLLKKFQSVDFLNKNVKHQFCGESLVYAVEYYCVYIKGTSLYTPDYNFENTHVYGDESNQTTADEEKSRRNVKVNDSLGTLVFPFLFRF